MTEIVRDTSRRVSVEPAGSARGARGGSFRHRRNFQRLGVGYRRLQDSHAGRLSRTGDLCRYHRYGVCHRHRVWHPAAKRTAILPRMGFIFDIIFSLIGGVFGSAWDDRLAARRQRSGRVDCGLRVIAGSQAGLKSRWKGSRADVHAGRLEFGRMTAISVVVTAVGTEVREPRGAERWVIFDSGYRIVELRTDSATLEWAVRDDKLEWALARLRGSGIPSPDAVPL